MVELWGVTQRGVVGGGLQDHERPRNLKIEDLDVDHDGCSSGGRWRALADAMFNSDGMHVLDVR